MTASQLEYLDAALSHESWKHAAATLGVSGSALSQGLAELERRLGLTLFERDGRQRVPTAEAHEAADHARRILAELRELRRWADEIRGGASGQVAIGMIDTAAIHHFGDGLARFRNDHPDIELRLQVQPSNRLLDQLLAGQLDAAIVVDPDDDPRLTAQPLVDEALHIYAPPGTRVGRPATWGPWVGFPQDSRTRARIRSELRAIGASYDVIAESSQPAVLREMVQLGMGWCVLAATDAEAGPRPLDHARAKPIAHRTLTLVRRTGRQPTAALKLVLDSIGAS